MPRVHAGFDVSYTIDDLDRLDQADQGTWNGSAINSSTHDQDWTLDHVGNWDDVTLDLNDDGSFTGTDEYDDDRTHNDVNELTGRDTDDNGTDNYTLTYDAVGNLTDDGESYKYEYDPLGRMRKVDDQSDALVAEYRYNGMGHMISYHEDTDEDGDVDSGDLWYHHAYDELWRVLATYRDDDSDSDPREEFLPQQAGPDGLGGSSYIGCWPTSRATRRSGVTCFLVTETAEVSLPQSTLVRQHCFSGHALYCPRMVDGELGMP